MASTLDSTLTDEERRWVEEILRDKFIHRSYWPDAVESRMLRQLREKGWDI